MISNIIKELSGTKNNLIENNIKKMLTYVDGYNEEFTDDELRSFITDKDISLYIRNINDKLDEYILCQENSGIARFYIINNPEIKYDKGVISASISVGDVYKI